MRQLILKVQSFLILLVLVSANVQAQKSPVDMDRFIDDLMKKMTLEEKIGQLNLPVTGEITTGQAKSSNVAKRIRAGEVGGLFNLKGVERIRDVQKQAVEESRLGIPLLFGMDVIHGYETVFPIPLGLSCTWNMKAIEESARIAAIEASADGICWKYGTDVSITSNADEKNYVTVQDLVSEDKIRVVTIGDKKETDIVLGFTSCKKSDTDRISLADGLYFIQSAANNKYYASPIHIDGESAEWVSVDANEQNVNTCLLSNGLF